MLVYHGTTPQQARAFAEHGIDGHLQHPRLVHGPQDSVPGLFVTPIRWIARRFGLCVIEIQVESCELSAPPAFAQIGVSVNESLANPLEPQAFLSRRIEPIYIRIVECHENGYARNPYEPDEPQNEQAQAPVRDA